MRAILNLRKQNEDPEVILSARNNISHFQLSGVWITLFTDSTVTVVSLLPLHLLPGSLGLKNTITIHELFTYYLKHWIWSSWCFTKESCCFKQTSGLFWETVKLNDLVVNAVSIEYFKGTHTLLRRSVIFREQPVEGQTELIQTYHDTCSREFEPLIHPDNVTKLCML